MTLQTETLFVRTLPRQIKKMNILPCDVTKLVEHDSRNTAPGTTTNINVFHLIVSENKRDYAGGVH